ncbi:hypothetical protein ACKI2E_44235, partial [Streptomyces galilaeus]
GGICTPCIAPWPKGIKAAKGYVTDEICHVIDLMSTCVDIAGATYPTKYKGHNIIPMEGKSLNSIFQGEKVKRHDYVAFEHFN